MIFNLAFVRKERLKENIKFDYDYVGEKGELVLAEYHIKACVYLQNNGNTIDLPYVGSEEVENSIIAYFTAKGESAVDGNDTNFVALNNFCKKNTKKDNLQIDVMQINKYYYTLSDAYTSEQVLLYDCNNSKKV